MLDSFYHMTLKLLKNCIFDMNTLRFCHLIMDVITSRYYIYKPLVALYITPR